MRKAENGHKEAQNTQKRECDEASEVRSLLLPFCDFCASLWLNRLLFSRAVVEHRSRDRFGIVLFAGTDAIACPLTADRQAVVSRLAAVESGNDSGTAVGPAMLAAAKRFPPTSRGGILLVRAGVRFGRVQRALDSGEPLDERFDVQLAWLGTLCVVAGAVVFVATASGR